MLVLGELAAHVSEWHAPCSPIALRLAAMTAQAAGDLQDQINTQLQQAVAAAGRETGNQGATAGAAAGQGGMREQAEEAVASLRVKQARLRATALVCHGAGRPAGGPLKAEEAGAMVRLMVLLNHTNLYQELEEVQRELGALLVRAHR